MLLDVMSSCGPCFGKSVLAENVYMYHRQIGRASSILHASWLERLIQTVSSDPITDLMEGLHILLRGFSMEVQSAGESFKCGLTVPVAAADFNSAGGSAKLAAPHSGA
jgi:hypothetical protein